jgi:hypothetical protein
MYKVFMGENFGGGGFDVGEREDGDLTKNGSCREAANPFAPE